MAVREVLGRAGATAVVLAFGAALGACEGNDAAPPSVQTTTTAPATTTTTQPAPTTSVEYITAAATARTTTTDAPPSTEPDPAASGGPISAAADCRIARVVQRGERGGDVVCVQQALNDWLAANGVATRVTVDGIFGPGTESAVKDMQQRAGLGVDGLVGPATGSALGIWG